MKQILLGFMILTLAACAYSPQQVTIKPQINIADESYGNGRSIAVSGEDGREKKVLGTRGGIYEETSTITLANDMTKAIVTAAKAKLATQGFNVNSADSDATLKLVVEELTYDLPESVGKKVDLFCVIRVEAQAGTETYTGKYRTGSTVQTVFTPTMARNEAMINELISDTLVRAFSDPKLIAFLSNI